VRAKARSGRLAAAQAVGSGGCVTHPGRARLAWSSSRARPSCRRGTVRGAFRLDPRTLAEDEVEMTVTALASVWRAGTYDCAVTPIAANSVTSCTGQARSRSHRASGVDPGRPSHYLPRRQSQPIRRCPLSRHQHGASAPVAGYRPRKGRNGRVGERPAHIGDSIRSQEWARGLASDIEPWGRPPATGAREWSSRGRTDCAQAPPVAGSSMPRPAPFPRARGVHGCSSTSSRSRASSPSATARI
jgi:hypothetical protein